MLCFVFAGGPSKPIYDPAQPLTRTGTPLKVGIKDKTERWFSQMVTKGLMSADGGPPGTAVPPLITLRLQKSCNTTVGLAATS